LEELHKARLQPAALEHVAAGAIGSQELGANDRVGEFLDFRTDVLAQRCESGDNGDGDERCGYCVLRKFKTSFITEKSLNHFVAPFGFD
jgi:hypothetical protein